MWRGFSRRRTVRFYLLLDEIQIVKQWEDVINSLQLDRRFDIVLTGSNANLLAAELATRLSGRLSQVHPDLGYH